MSGMLLTMMIIVAGFVTTTPDLTRFRLPAPGPGTVAAIERSVVDAGLGGCWTEITVRDGYGHPVEAASIHLEVRYGFMGAKRLDLDLGTDAHGKARVQGLPEKAAPVAYGIAKGDATSRLNHDVGLVCRGRYDVTIK